MALDLSTFRKKLNELTSGVKGPFWKPKDAETVIRIVPLKSNPSNPFQELYFHYIDGKTYLSPMTFGDDDPFMELSLALVSEGNLSKEAFKEAMRMRPAPRVYVPVIVRGEEKLGVRFWGFSQAIFKDLLTIMSDGEYGDITDTEAGHDIKVMFTAADKTATKFPETKIMVKPKPTSLSDDPAVLSTFLNEQPVLLEEYTVSTYDELTVLLNKKHGSAEETPAAPAPAARAKPVAKAEDDDWAEPPKKTDAPATVRGATPKPTPAPAAAASDDVDEEFDNIFNS